MNPWILATLPLLACVPAPKGGETGGPEGSDGDSGEAETGADSQGPDSQGQDSAGDTGEAPGPPWGDKIYDVEIFDDEITLNLEVVSEESRLEGGVEVSLREIRFTGYEVSDGALVPVVLQGFLALPADAASPVPGVVLAHGLGGMGDPDAASALAGALEVVTLAYSGPGQGDSEGRSCDVNNLFRTTPDPRESWFWSHTVAGLRALTVLGSLPEVDGDRLAMAGTSAGALATLTAAGVDPRVVAAVAISGTGYLDEAAAAGGWENDLLASTEPPLDRYSEAWASYDTWLDPRNFLAGTTGDALLINGAQDEFFPITSTVLTLEALSATPGEHRVTHIKDWDHGWLSSYSGVDAAETIEGTLRYFLASRLGLDPARCDLPPQPQVESVAPWTCGDPATPAETWSCAWATVSLPGGADCAVEAVQLHWSFDGLVYESAPLSRVEGADTWTGELPDLDGALHGAGNVVWFAEFDFTDAASGETFTLTSMANVPDGFVPTILTTSGDVPR